MGSTTRRTGRNFRKLIEARAKQVARNTIRTGWSTEMDASSETVKIAIYNALGTDTIPARPTLEPTMNRTADLIRAENKAIVRIVNRGADPVPLMDRLASRLEDAVVAVIVELQDPPNAQSTIDKKGFDDPLIGAGSEGGRLVAEVASRRIRK